MNSDGIHKRIVVTGYIIVAAFAIIAARVWQLQVLKGGHYLRMSENNRIKVLKIPAPRGIIYDRHGTALVKNTPFYSVALIPEAALNVDTKALSSLLSMSEEEIDERLSMDVPPFETFKLKEGLSFDKVAYIEARRSDFPGLIIEPEAVRYYVYGDVASHVVGYLGMMGPEKAEILKKSDVPPDAFVGKWGVEAFFDERLRGKSGKRYIEVDALGRQLKIIREDPPQKGEDITLSLDINLQEEIEKSFKHRTGAAVVFDPNNGEILSLVSLPSFDPNLFSRGISAIDWIAINKNPEHPFLNRAVQSHYPPGSVFKIVVAAAALEENVLPEDFKVKCNGKIRYGNWQYRCWKRYGHGVVDLHRGIVESCDIFFYTVGELLGMDTIAEYAKMFGFGGPSGIPFIDEKTGFIPTTAWKKETLNKEWYKGETYHSAIGQGYVLTTPIQQALMASAVANNGTVYTPKITKSPDEGTVSRTVNLSPSTLNTIKEAMKGVVNERHGTGRAAGSGKYIVSGKTGTAQVIKSRNVGVKNMPARFRDHAWFVAFAPYERPEMAMSVLVEHGGHGGSAAAPIARKAIDYYLSGKEGDIEKRAAID